VVVIGTALDEVSTSGWDSSTIMSNRLIHLSNNPEHLSRSYMAKLCILGSLELMLKPFMDFLRTNSARRKWFMQQNAYGLPINLSIQQPQSCLDHNGKVKPQALMTYMSDVCPDETRALFDSGNSFLWGIHYWNCRRPQSFDANKSLFHIGIGFASMGWAIGAAVGVAAGAKGQPVVCVTGDGSMLMSGQEITVAAQHQFGVMFVVLNDSSLGMVRHGQKLSGGESIGHELPQINFALMAQAMGIEAYRIESMDDLMALDIRQLLASNKPCLLDVVIDGDEVPPMGARMKVLTGAA
ncbi:MAG TPA: thiamine pyrophosphate-dependent enzyme, partial [Agitococcus sp.]|nr:thiamine pyrophosphate-dependent enzyme [Agitococcus sp.]